MQELKDFYEKGNAPYVFPSHWVDPDVKKSKEWGLCVAKAIWAYQTGGFGATSHIAFGSLNYQELRAYAEGTQSNTKYMDMLCPKGRDGKRKHRYNISWDVVSYFPRYENAILGIFDKVEHEIDVQASDPYSDDRKDNVRWLLWDKMKKEKFHSEVAKMLGEQESQDFNPSNSEELDLYLDLAFKLKDEIASQAMITQNLNDSDWDEIKILLLSDAIRLGIAIAKDEVNPHSNKIYARYIDPATFIGQKTKSRDGHGMEFGAHIEWMTILDIKQSINEGQISEEEFKTIADKFIQFNSNGASSASVWNQGTQDSHGAFPYDSFKVPVLCYERISWDRSIYTSRITEKGNQIVEKQKHDYKGIASEKREVIKSDRKTRYKGKWIIGSTHLFDYGLDTFIPAEGFKDVHISYTMYKFGNRSMVSQIIQDTDLLNLARYKFQNAWALADPKGYALEEGMLSNISLGKKKTHPLDLIKIKKETGVLLYKKTGSLGRNKSGQTVPVTEMDGGIGVILNEYQETAIMCENSMTKITGLSEALLGSDPQNNALVGTTQLAVIQSNNRLQPIYKGYLSIKKRICKNFLGRAQTIARTDPEKLKAYYPVLGSTKMNILEFASDLSKAGYELRLEAKPTDEMKANLRKNIDTAIQTQAIDVVDSIEIEYFMERGTFGDLKYAQRLLVHRQKIKSQQASEAAAQNAQMNQQMQAQSLEQSHQQQLEIIEAEQQGKLQIQQSLKEIEDRQMARDAELKLQIQQLIGAQTLANTRLKGELELDKAEKVAEMKPETKQ